MQGWYCNDARVTLTWFLLVFVLRIVVNHHFLDSVANTDEMSILKSTVFCSSYCHIPPWWMLIVTTLQLNRSDSDSSVKYRRGPFQRSAIERRSLRFKKVLSANDWKTVAFSFGIPVISYNTMNIHVRAIRFGEIVSLWHCLLTDITTRFKILTLSTLTKQNVSKTFF